MSRAHPGHLRDRTRAAFGQAIVGMVLVGMLCACAVPERRENPELIAITAENLVQVCSREWRLTDWRLAGEQLPLVEQSKITFGCNANGRVAGNATINRYFGQLELDAQGVLSWSEPGFGVTMMAGPPDLMAQEQRFLDLISDTTRMTLEGEQLVLTGASADTRLVFDSVLAVEAERLIGVWLRPVRNPPDGTDAQEGLRFLPEGIVHLIGIYSMNGLTWQLESDRLTISTNTERYPEPHPLRYRITRLDAGSLIIEGDDYLAGSYDRAAAAPAEPLPASRAAAIAANVAAYRKVSGRLSMGDATADFDAYYRDTILRYIDEHVDQGDLGSTRNEYFLDSAGLFYYRSQSDLAAQSPGRPGERERRLLIMAFDETGHAERAIKVVDGKTVEPMDSEPAGPGSRLKVLLEALEHLKTSSPGR